MYTTNWSHSEVMRHVCSLIKLRAKGRQISAENVNKQKRKYDFVSFSFLRDRFWTALGTSSASDWLWPCLLHTQKHKSSNLGASKHQEHHLRFTQKCDSTYSRIFYLLMFTFSSWLLMMMMMMMLRPLCLSLFSSSCRCGSIFKCCLLRRSWHWTFLLQG